MNARVRLEMRLWRAHVRKGTSYRSDEGWAVLYHRRHPEVTYATVVLRDWSPRVRWMWVSRWKISREPILYIDCPVSQLQWTRERGEILPQKVRSILMLSVSWVQSLDRGAHVPIWVLMYQLGEAFRTCLHCTFLDLIVNFLWEKYLTNNIYM